MKFSSTIVSSVLAAYAFVGVSVPTSEAKLGGSSLRSLQSPDSLDSLDFGDDLSSLKGYFAGSGSFAFSQPETIDNVIGLLPESKQKDLSKINVVILSTATYDTVYDGMDSTIDLFTSKGCSVDMLNIAFDRKGYEDLQKEEDDNKLGETLIDKADIIVVGGGNTLFAVDRWLHKGYVKPALQRAMDRGAVLSGGSAGAICWFGSGHSDSCDPKSYVDAKLESREYKFYNDEQYDDLLICPSPLSLEEQENNDGDWNYIQIPGIGFLPGLLTPHHDSVQSNGVLRSNDLDRMLLQIAGAVLEHSDKNKKTKQALISQITGIGIDNYAALSVDGDSYSVYGLPGQKGSVGYDYYNDGKPTWSVTDDGNRTGVPGIWIKHVVPKNSTVDLNDINNYKVQYDLLPAEGKLLELYGYDYDEEDGTYTYDVSVDEDVGSIEISRTIDLMNGIMSPLNELSENMKYVDSINKEVQDELGRCRAENPSFC